MGADRRPQRNSKVRAQLRLREVGDSDAAPDEGFSLEASRLRPARGKRNITLDESSEEDADMGAATPEDDLSRDVKEHDSDAEEEGDGRASMDHDASPTPDFRQPVQRSRVSVEESDGDADFADDDLDPDESQPLAEAESYLPKGEILVDGAIVTKSGRVSKRPQPSPLFKTSPRPRRSSARAVSLDLPLTREERMRRRSSDVNGMQDVEAPHKLTRLRKTRTVSYAYDNDDELEDDEDEYGQPAEDMAATGLERMTRSRSGKSGTVRNSHRRYSTRRRSSLGGAVDHAFDSKGRSVVAPNGLRRSLRRTTSVYEIETRRGRERDQDEDGDYATPVSGEESEDVEPGQFHEEEVLLDEEAAPEESELDAPNSQRRPTRSSRTRKAQPQRTVPAKRKRNSTRTQLKESVARQTRKSFRSRSVSLRPEDFYPETESSSDGVALSEELAPVAKRPRPARAAASRAEDAIASKIDYLERPMATTDAGPQKRPQHGRYSRRRNRMRPTGIDPFVSDGDDGLSLGPVPAGIEPIQVDMSLSWDDIGGLDHHVRALKETVSLPLLYPEIFEKFNMEAPRGVLFYGPPGTGKTLCARALAASCGSYLDDSQDALVGLNSTQKSANGADERIPGQCVFDPTSESAKEGDDGKKPSNTLAPSEKATELEANSGKDILLSEAITAPVHQDGHVSLGPQTLAIEHQRTVLERADAIQKRVEFAKSAKVQGGMTARASPTFVQSKTPGSSEQPPVKKKPRVAFFMRNGADCLSKWVGEAERQLRMTFEAAKKHQPSIIFFDEIDGLAPVRSSRQDQIHSSIVSTLLGLMDGLDARGKVVVIGATNRVDAIDPALRRPGRFDRELIFTLPNLRARRRILGIHTSRWTPPPNSDMLDEVARMTVGYCGADLKSLCSEAAIRALRRRYPQIYQSRDKLLINVDEVRVSTKDFLAAMREIVPASHRSARTYARPISERLAAVLSGSLQNCISILRQVFPQGLEPEAKMNSGRTGDRMSATSTSNGFSAEKFSSKSISSDDDDDEVLRLGAAEAGICNAGRIRPGGGTSRFGKFNTHRPRLLICGSQGLGQAQLGPAILHSCEGCPVHAIDYPSLHADAGARSAEEALISAFREALRSVPSVLYLPHLQLWWESAPPSLKTTLIIALKDIPADLPLLVLATAESSLNELPPEVTELFGELSELSAPSENSRKRLFAPLLEQAQAIPRLSQAAAHRLRMKRRTEILPKAPPPPPKPATFTETNQKLQNEDRYIRLLRMEMRAFADSLLRDRRYKAFWNPVDPTAAPDYYDIIMVPMDISKIASQIDLGKYPTVLSMVNDFDIMVRNAIQYNPPNTEMGAEILRRAHGLIDIVHAWVDNLNPSVVETCNKIVAERVSRRQQELSSREDEKAKKEKSGPGEEAQQSKKMEVEAVVQTVANGVDEPEIGAEIALIDNDIPAPHESGANGRVEKEARNEPIVVDSGRDGSDEIGEEAIVPAKRGDVVALQRLLLDVSTGITVDGLEGLYVRCANVLHAQRRCLDRTAVVNMLMKTVTEAREDPAVVGNLVA